MNSVIALSAVVLGFAAVAGFGYGVFTTYKDPTLNPRVRAAIKRDVIDLLSTAVGILSLTATILAGYHWIHLTNPATTEEMSQALQHARSHGEEAPMLRCLNDTKAKGSPTPYLLSLGDLDQCAEAVLRDRKSTAQQHLITDAMAHLADTR